MDEFAADDALGRLEVLQRRRVKPEDCKSAKATKKETLDWVAANVTRHVDDIDESQCPSMEAWNMLLSFCDEPQKFFVQYKRASMTLDEAKAQDVADIPTATILRQLEKASEAFKARQRSGESLN